MNRCGMLIAQTSKHPPKTWQFWNMLYAKQPTPDQIEHNSILDLKFLKQKAGYDETFLLHEVLKHSAYLNLFAPLILSAFC